MTEDDSNALVDIRVAVRGGYTDQWSAHQVERAFLSLLGIIDRQAKEFARLEVDRVGLLRRARNGLSAAIDAVDADDPRWDGINQVWRDITAIVGEAP